VVVAAVAVVPLVLSVGPAVVSAFTAKVPVELAALKQMVQRLVEKVALAVAMEIK
jgi:hypothetical protein